MKKFMIEIVGVDDDQSVSILNAVYDTIASCKGSCIKPMEITYHYEEELAPIPPAPESTAFSRYISNTTPEGRT